MKAEIIKVTPVMAEKWLLNNRSNRPLRHMLVGQYAQDIRAQNWQLNGESLKVGPTGELIDGQHRLHACVKAGVPFWSVVVRDVPKEAFHTIDTGMKRSVAQILTMAGVGNASNASAGARWIVIIESAWSGSINFHKAVSAQNIFDAIERHPLIHHYATKFTAKGTRSLLTSSCISAFVLAGEKYGPELMDEFLDRFESGEGLKKGDPVYELRERMITSRSRLTRLTATSAVALTIKAVKAYADGRRIGVLRFSESEDFPTL